MSASEPEAKDSEIVTSAEGGVLSATVYFSLDPSVTESAVGFIVTPAASLSASVAVTESRRLRPS